MKRYEDVSFLKGLACLAVLITHWLGAFGSFGNHWVDVVMSVGPFPVLTYGTVALSLFFMLSGMLMSEKVYENRFSSWSREIVRRYVRLMIPVLITSAMALLLFRGNLFFCQQAAELMGNEWLGSYYGELPGWGTLIKKALFETIFLGDAVYYGPFWMLRYTFFGSIFSLILALCIRECTLRGKLLLFAFLTALMIDLDSHYLCFVLGSYLPLLWKKIRTWIPGCACDGKQESVSDKETASRRNRRGFLLGILVLTAGIVLARKSFSLAAAAAGRGVENAFGNASFYGIFASVLFIVGMRLFWEHGWNRLPCWLNRPILWLGEHSMGVYLLHWLIICSFSCWFYCRFAARGESMAVGLNLLLTLVVTGTGAWLFGWLVERKAVAFLEHWMKRHAIFREE